MCAYRTGNPEPKGHCYDHTALLSFEQLAALADRVCIAPTIPAKFRLAPKTNKPLSPEEVAGNVLAVAMAGQELGLPPMQSLNLFHIIEGAPVA